MLRLEDAILCPTTNPDHNPALLNDIRAGDRNFLEYEYATEEEMDAYYLNYDL